MPMHCSAYGCTNRHGKASRAKGITFHRFPKDVTWRLQWLTSLRRIDEYGNLWQPGVDAVLCSQHFHEDDFYYQFSRKLVKPGILPTVFNFSANDNSETSIAQVYAGTMASKCVVTSWNTLNLANDNVTVGTNDQPFEVTDLNTVPSCDEAGVRDCCYADPAVRYSAAKRQKLKHCVKGLHQTMNHSVGNRRKSGLLQSGTSNALTEFREMNIGIDYFNNVQVIDQLDSLVHCPSVTAKRVHAKLGNVAYLEIMPLPHSLRDMPEKPGEIDYIVKNEVSIKHWNCENCFNKESVRVLSDAMHHVNGVVKRIVAADTTLEPVSIEAQNTDDEIKTAAKALLQLSATHVAIADAVGSSASV